MLLIRLVLSTTLILLQNNELFGQVKLGGLDVFVLVIETSWNTKAASWKESFGNCLSDMVFDFGNDDVKSHFAVGCSLNLNANNSDGYPVKFGKYDVGTGTTGGILKDKCGSTRAWKDQLKTTLFNAVEILNDTRKNASIVTFVLADDDLFTNLSGQSYFFQNDYNVMFIIVNHEVTNETKTKLAGSQNKKERILTFNGSCDAKFAGNLRREICADGKGAENPILNETACQPIPKSSASCSNKITKRPQIRRGLAICQNSFFVADYQCTCGVTPTAASNSSDEDGSDTEEAWTTTAQADTVGNADESSLPYIVGIVVAVVVFLGLLAVVIVGCYLKRRRKNQADAGDEIETLVKSKKSVKVVAKVTEQEKTPKKSPKSAPKKTVKSKKTAAKSAPKKSTKKAVTKSAKKVPKSKKPVKTAAKTVPKPAKSPKAKAKNVKEAKKPSKSPKGKISKKTAKSKTPKK